MNVIRWFPQQLENGPLRLSTSSLETLPKYCPGACLCSTQSQFRLKEVLTPEKN